MKAPSNPPRGDQTRRALIVAAIDVFGRTGFDAASTRALARAAGVNQALIGYHFGGKRGLYIAVFEHIASQMQEHMVPVAEEVTRQLNELPRYGAPRGELAQTLLLNLFDAFLEMQGGEAAAHWVPLVLREQQNPTEAFDIIYDSLIGPVLGLVTRLVAIASGMDETSEACRIRTLMILGQALIFRVARGTTERQMLWQTLTPENISAIKQQFRQSIESQFSQRAILS